MIAKQILYFDTTLILACDANCQKAWGINSRPRRPLSQDEDDYELLADDDLLLAPDNPGTYEGRDAKPVTPAQRLNRWCCRECERSVMVKPGEDFELPDFSKPLPNKHERR